MKVLRELALNAAAGARLSLMLPTRIGLFRSGADQAVLLSAIYLILTFCLYYAFGGFFQMTDPQTLYVQFLKLLGLLLGIYLVARFLAAGRGMLMQPLLVVILSSLLPIIVALIVAILTGALPFLAPNWPKYMAFAVPVWLIAVLFRATRITHIGGFWRSVASVCVLATTFIVIPNAAPWGIYGIHILHFRLMAPPKEANAAAKTSRPKRPRMDVEGTYYAQSRLMDEALNGLVRERPGVADLYFVAFAGYGEQRVFLSEVRAVTRLFQERFGAASRSLMLANSRDTLATVPLANTHNLERGLEAVRSKMNVDEDVLFLFLTSHGSSTHELSVSNGPLRLNDMPAASLRRVLDRSGIKWKVIVISACYSGGFIDVLKDEKSLILTAARRDRTSFGCSDDADFTYFGRAYFDQALRRQNSFIEAFHEARKLIAEREQEEKLTPSEPQIFVGAKIEAKLAQLEAGFAPAPQAARMKSE